MAVSKAKSYTITFAAINLAARPTRRSGISWNVGDAQISQDGGAFCDTTNLPFEIGATGRYKIALTAAEMNADWVHIKIAQALMDDVDIMIATNAAKTCAVVGDAGNSATAFKTSLTESANDHWKDALVVFDAGTLAGQVKKISAYNGTTKVVTLSSAFTGTPAAGDIFTIINM